MRDLSRDEDLDERGFETVLMVCFLSHIPYPIQTIREQREQLTAVFLTLMPQGQ